VAIYRVIPERSRLWATARSSLHPIKVLTDGLTGTGTVQAEVVNGQVRLGVAIRVEIAADKLRSGNSLVDSELQRRLEARKFPHVVGAVRAALPLPSGRTRLLGDLSLHGVSKATEAEVSARVVDERTIEIEGEQVIDMRDHGLTPPKFLLFRVRPDVRVRARLLAERQT
jgi:polyisoprenoid-binding protein YceI